MATTTTSSAPSTTAVVDHSNLQNNLFSDFGPLLALFGDDLTTQFLSTSMGLADDVLLGIAPIGIIVTIVCAIRIGGGKVLRSFIGR